MKFNVTDVEFDFDDMYSNDDFTCLSFDEEIELYLSEVGDGDPDLQFTPQEEYVMHQRCLGRWTAYNEDDLRNRIFDFIGYHAEHLKYEVRS